MYVYQAAAVMTSLPSLHQGTLKHKKLALRILFLCFFFTLLGLPLLELQRQDTCDELHLKDMLANLVSRHIKCGSILILM